MVSGSFGDRLLRFMEKSGLSQKKLAAGIGCSESYLSKILNNTREPRYELMQRIIQETKIPSCYFFGVQCNYSSKNNSEIYVSNSSIIEFAYSCDRINTHIFISYFLSSFYFDDAMKYVFTNTGCNNGTLSVVKGSIYVEENSRRTSILQGSRIDYSNTDKDRRILIGFSKGTVTQTILNGNCGDFINNMKSNLLQLNHKKI